MHAWSLKYTYVIVIATMDTSGLPDMRIHLKPKGIHIRQTTNVHGIAIATPSGMQKTAILVLQVHA